MFPRKPATPSGVPTTKGHFLIGDGTRIDPLTITDTRRRFWWGEAILWNVPAIHVLGENEAGVREFGMPHVIHTDNGVPFASVAPGGMSRLSIWFVKLGILPERSRPGSPQDNGRHERMHRTLKQATAAPPQPVSAAAAESLRRILPRVQSASPARGAGRPHPGGLLSVQCAAISAASLVRYSDDLEVRRVSQQGSIRWKGQRTFISEDVPL